MSEIKFEAPKERNLFFNKQVDQETIGELTKSIVEINEHDEKLKKVYEIYDEISKKAHALKEIYDGKKDWYMTAEEAMEFGVNQLLIKICKKVDIYKYRV
jgi:archaellum component FlaC